MSQTENAQTKLENLKQLALQKMKEAANSQSLYDVKVEFMGKSGQLTEIMKEMAKLPKEEKPLFGKWVNQVKTELEEVPRLLKIWPTFFWSSNVKPSKYAETGESDLFSWVTDSVFGSSLICGSFST